MLLWSEVTRLCRIQAWRLMPVGHQWFDEDDLTQEALAGVWQTARTADGVEAAPGMVARMARRDIIDALIRYRVYGHTRHAYDYKPLEPAAQSLDEPGPGATSPRGAILHVPEGPDREALMDLDRLLRRLSQRERVILLAMACGWTQRELEPALGVGWPYISQLAGGARQRLRGTA